MAAALLAPVEVPSPGPRCRRRVQLWHARPSWLHAPPTIDHYLNPLTAHSHSSQIQLLGVLHHSKQSHGRLGIADRVLAADDIDHYMDFRAVYRTWRSSTVDPNASPRDPSFRPRRWALLDEEQQTDARLFVNVATGRFVLRKDLPLLRSMYFLIAGAAGGLLVLAERSATHAARVLNTFTGSLIRFKAPVPPELEVAAHVIGSSSPTLVLVCDKSPTIYWADADDESFHVYKEEQYHHPFVSMALVCGIYAAAREHGSLAFTSYSCSQQHIASGTELVLRDGITSCHPWFRGGI